MKNFKKIVLAIMLLCSINALSAEITLTDNRGKKEKIDTFAIAINKITKENNEFTSFNIYGANNLGEAGAQAIANALINPNCKLTSLNIDSNKIGPYGAPYIADALNDKNCKLTSLRIVSTEFGPNGTLALAKALKNEKCKLTSLNIGANKIGLEGLLAIVEALKNENCELTSLDISWNKIGPDGALAIAEALNDKNCKLTSLDISWNEIGDAGATAISDELKNENCNIIFLNIEKNNINMKLNNTINFTMTFCAINNLKRMIENYEINEENYIKIIFNARNSFSNARNSSYAVGKLNENRINWYNSLQNEDLPYLDAEYKEELDDKDIKTRNEAVKYIKDKFDNLDKELELELEKKNKNFDEFINNEKLMDMLGVKRLLREDFGQGDFGEEI